MKINKIGNNHKIERRVSNMKAIIVAGAITTLAIISCNNNKKEEKGFKTPPPSYELAPNIDISTIKNSQIKNTIPYIASHNIGYYDGFDNIKKSKKLVDLDTSKTIVLDSNAGKSEKEAYGGVGNPNEFVYLNTTAHKMLIDIQNELNEKLTSLGYQNTPVYLQVNSATRSHDAQSHLAKKEINATNNISAHETGIAVDISCSNFFYTNGDNEKQKIENQTTLQAIYKILNDIFMRDINKKFFITPESTGIVHIVFLIYGSEYDQEETIKHPPHKKKKKK